MVINKFLIALFLLFSAGTNLHLLSQETLSDTVWSKNIGVTQVKFSPDDQYIYVNTGTSVIQLLTSDGSPIDTLFEHGGSNIYFYFSHSGDTVITSGRQNLIKLWDRKSGDLIKTINFANYFSTTVNHARITADGKRIIGQTGNNFNNLPNIFVYDLINDSIIATLDTFYDYVVKFNISPMNNYLFGAFYKGGSDPFRMFIIYNLVNYKKVVNMLSEDAVLNAIEFSPDGKLIAVCADGFLKIFDIDNMGWKKEISMDQKFSNLCFSKNNKYLIVGTGYPGNAMIYIYETTYFEKIYEYKHPFGGGNALDISTDSKYIINGTPPYLRLLNNKWSTTGIIEPERTEIKYTIIDGQLRIELKEVINEQATITFFDVSGKIVKIMNSGLNNIGSNIINLDISTLQNGVYLVEINSPHFIKTFKLIKEG